MTRRPAAVSVATQPGKTQFTSAVEAKPCTRTIGSPSPSSRNAISTPSCWNRCIFVLREARSRPPGGDRCGTLGRGPMGWDQRKRRTEGAARAAKPAARAIAFSDPFGHTLERGNKTEERHVRPEQPRREVESAQRENDRAAARELEDRAGLAPLGRSEARDPGHVTRSFGEL